MQSTESSVCSIIAAFTSGLDVFRKFRQRRKKSPSSCKGPKGGVKHASVPKHPQRDSKANDEARLTQSLRRGSDDVYKAYAHHARHDGLRFAAGDSAAHASLTQTLLKLNSGLVNIISAFLTHGRHDVSVDYGSLTALSDRSRMEAIDAMERLHSRLAHANLSLRPRVTANKQRTDQRGGKADTRHTKGSKAVERSSELPPGIAMVTMNTSQTQLAWARPVKKRKGSTASSKAGSTSKTPSSPQSSVPTTPLPAYSPPLSQMTYPFPPPTEQHQPAQQHAPPRQHAPQLRPQAPRVAPIQSSGAAAPVTARRQDKVTPSFYSIATDSTKLGEIPMRKWTTPFDQAEADRLNALALASGWRPPPPPPTLEQQQKGRSRLRRLFRKRQNAAGYQQAVH